MHEAHPLGSIAQLWRYPVKSLGPEPLERIAVEPVRPGRGPARRAVRRARPGTHASASRIAAKSTICCTPYDAGAARTLAAERGVDVERRDDGPHFDAGTISIVLDLWLADLERHLGFPLDPQRYRPNLFVRAAPGFSLREPELIGATLRSGTVSLRVSEPIGRCVTTTYDVASGESNPEILRAVANERNNIMGVYCEVLETGALERGATLTFEMEASS